VEITDPKISDVGMLWSRFRTRRFFNRAVVPLLCPERTLTKFNRKHTRYSPGRHARVLYELRFEGEAAPSYAAVSFGRWKKLRGIYDRYYGHLAEGANGNGPVRITPGAALYLREYPCLVELFPCAWRLPSLVAALDPVAMSARLAGVSPPFTVEAVELLRYRPHKSAVLSYDLRAQGGEEQQAIGKVFPSGEKAADVFAKMTQLYSQAPQGLRVPQPLRVIEHLSLVLMERLPGETVKRLLQRTKTTGEAAPIVRAAAGALVAFRPLRVETERRRTLQV
jgi:hypothetical protein